MFKQIRNPDIYHGSNKKRNYFEGWYFKIVDRTHSHSYAFIPGIFLGNDSFDSHSFIQVIGAGFKESLYIKHPLESFNASSEKMLINIDENIFSIDSMSININVPSFTASGKIKFKNVKKWPDSIINPGSMGFYNYLSFMQCYSQVCALDMELEGILNIDGKNVDFTSGKGYIEKNWGKSFPYSWIWIQCNDFIKSEASLSCSIGHIPFPLGSFRGFLIGLTSGNDFYSFTTIKQNDLRIKKIHSDVIIKSKNKRYMLTIKTRTKPKEFIPCYGPRDDKMKVLLEETLSASIDIELVDYLKDKIILKDCGLCAGIEFGGEQMMILNNDKNPGM